jgi:hypothetical protein
MNGCTAEMLFLNRHQEASLDGSSGLVVGSTAYPREIP